MYCLGKHTHTHYHARCVRGDVKVVQNSHKMSVVVVVVVSFNRINHTRTRNLPWFARFICSKTSSSDCTPVLRRRAHIIYTYRACVCESVRLACGAHGRPNAPHRSLGWGKCVSGSGACPRKIGAKTKVIASRSQRQQRKGYSHTHTRALYERVCTVNTQHSTATRNFLLAF